MQRRKLTTTKNQHTGRDATPVASVVRHRFGTGPFDQFWLNWDCCGLFCAAITYALHIYGCYAVTCVLLPSWMSYKVGEERKLTIWGQINSVCFCLVALLAVVSHFKAMTTDPGSVPPDAEPLLDNLDILSIGSNNGNGNGNGSNDAHSPNTKPKPKPRPPKRICRRCNSFKPDRAHHCSICKRCILKMDHHCPWVNNCVGIGNHKYFLLFVFYTCFSCFYAISLVILRFVDCLGHLEKHEPCLDHPTHLLSLIGLMIESMLFGTFTCCMVIDQWDVVMTNITHIDRLKGETTAFLSGNDDVDGSGASLAGINEVFGIGLGKGKRNGGRFRPDWLSPFTQVCFPENMKDEIMGFCRSCPFATKVKEDDYDTHTTTTTTTITGRKNLSSVGDIV